jgi:hypothetical protein
VRQHTPGSRIDFSMITMSRWFYANLANALFAMIYCKLLIPRLGT